MRRGSGITHVSLLSLTWLFIWTMPRRAVVPLALRTIMLELLRLPLVTPTQGANSRFPARQTRRAMLKAPIPADDDRPYPARIDRGLSASGARQDDGRTEKTALQFAKIQSYWPADSAETRRDRLRDVWQMKAFEDGLDAVICA